MKCSVWGGGHLASVFGQAIALNGITAYSDDPDIVFIAAGVESHGDIAHIDMMMEKALGQHDVSVSIVVTSQVPPGWTRTWGDGRPYVYYHPHTLIAGSEVADAMRPVVQPVGCMKPSEALPDAYSEFLFKFGAVVKRMSYESAELSKLALNTILAANIEAANQAKRVADKVGANWADIEPVLRMDHRIGHSAYIRPGVVGGHLPRDVETMTRLDV